MAVTRAIAATATLAGLAVGAAGTAWADPATLSGHYIETETNAGGQSGTNDWYFTPCGPGCASIASNGGPIGQARLVNGQWTLDVTGIAGCANGTRVADALSDHYTWDPNTLAGSVKITANVAACGNPAGTVSTNTMRLRPA
jgi:hypothetical protein